MKKLTIILSVSLCTFLLLPFGEAGRILSQNIGISTTGAMPNASALLDIDASPGNNKGLLIPRLTTAQMNAIASPATGLIIYNTDCNTINYYNGTTWIALGNTGSVATPGAITGNTTPCQNATGIAYSIASVTGATGYNWTVPTGATVATGQGTTAITVNFAATNGNVCVTAYNACGSSNASCTAITLSSIPAQPSIITGTTPVCQSQSGVAYSVTIVGGVTYTWTYSGTGFTCATGCATNSITADFSAIATSGTLTVTPSNACGSGTAQTFAITVSATPTTANAGTDINPACDVNTATLAGNTPTVGTGLWTVISGTATITTPTSPTSGVTGLAVPGTATLRWTISNAPCADSFDDVVITTTSCCNITATGGTITSSGGKTIHTFTSSGTFNVTCAAPGATVEVVVVGGGGSGGYGVNAPAVGGGGGGGGGGYKYNPSFSVSIGSYTVVVGAGGSGTMNAGINGDASSFDALSAIGGGYGGVGTCCGSGTINGGNGGSGGGGGGLNSGASSGGTCCSDGSTGSNGFGTSSTTGGNGGGASGIGQAGKADDITGSIVAAGGIGRGRSVGSNGNGAANSGNGGGGSFGVLSGAGGSGIVIISYTP